MNVKITMPFHECGKNEIILGEICNMPRVVWGEYVAEGFETRQMNLRQKRVTNILSSIAIGLVGFCLMMPLVIFIGGILLGPLEGMLSFLHGMPLCL